MARRRSRQKSQSILAGGKSFLTTLKKILPITSFASTFYADAAQAMSSQSTIEGKLKEFANATTGKLTGINFFSDAGQYTFGVSVSNLNNPVTIGGVVLSVAGLVMKKIGIKGGGTLEGIGTSIAVPSAIGAVIGGGRTSGVQSFGVQTTLSSGQIAAI